MTTPRAGWPVAAGAMSGFAALGYQLVWTQQTSAWLGSEIAAVLAVVAAFFGGLSVGALVLAGRIDRGRRPVAAYVACELVIAVWSSALLWTMAPAGDGLRELIGADAGPMRQWAVAFAGTFCLLLPATAAMGATLPALERAARASAGRAVPIAALYAANTAGAVAGVVACAFWLVPALGLARTAAVCVGLNAAAALVVAARASSRAGSGAHATRATLLAPTVRPHDADGRRVLAALAVTGLLGIGYEVVVARVLSQVSEDTVYTFAWLLTVYLLGTAAGAAALPRWRARVGESRTGPTLHAALAVACGLGAVSLWAAPWWRDAVLAATSSVHPTLRAAIAAEAAPAVAAFALPTLAMGALFAHLCERARAVGVPLGRAVGVNTLGGALAPGLFGVVLVPLLGPARVLVVVVAGYSLMAMREARAVRCSRPAGLVTAVAVGVSALALVPPLAFVDLPDGARVVAYRDGASASVSVVEDAEGTARLFIDNRQQEGSSATRLVDARQAVLPLLLHPSPRRVLFLGLGTGVTARVAASDPTMQVTAVELLPEVVAASTHFVGSTPARHAAAARLNVVEADARRFVRTTADRYDAIVADNFQPARSGAGALYTVEHFGAVRGRLAPGGVFCQWLPLHQLDLDTLRSIVRSFLVAFPDGRAILASHSLSTPVIGLVSGGALGSFDESSAADRLSRTGFDATLHDLRLDTPLALLGSVVAGPRSLARFAGDAPLNTDDRPVVRYGAPRATYAPESTPADRLVSILHAWSAAPADVLAAGSDLRFAQRLEAYWVARDRFIAAGIGMRPVANPSAMLAQVRAPLFDVLRASPEFSPASEPLFALAAALEPTDPGAAASLRAALARVTQPRESVPR